MNRNASNVRVNGTLASIAMCAALVAGGCSPPSDARFEVDGVVRHEDCLAETFPFEPIFHAYRERGNSAGLFFQSRGGNIQFTDLVHFEVFEPESVETGVPLPLDPIVGRDTKVASGIALGESCPELFESFALKGTIVFDSWSEEIHGLIAGEVDGSLESLRSGEPIASSFTGTFEFTVQVGQPFEEFRN